MALSQMFSDAYTVIGQKERLDESRRQREAQQSLSDILGSGRPLDEQTIMEAYRLDPSVGVSLSRLYSGQQAARAKADDMASRQGVRGAGALAGAAKQLLDGWNNNMPDEKKTVANWRRGYLPARAAAIRSGIATPDMLPEDLGPQDLEGIIGLGYSPAQQDLSGFREKEAVARQGRFDEGQAAQQSRFGESLALRERIAGAGLAERRRATDEGMALRERMPGKKSGGRKESDFERTMNAAGLQPGSPEYIRAARVKAGLEQRPGSGGIEMSYDPEGRPVVNIGGKPLTEQQAKNAINATAAEQAQAEMDAVRKSGFDPTSAGGAAQVFGADIPGVRNLVSDEAQSQASANRNLSAALNYARSGANITELELENTQKALLDRYGDKPEVTEYKKQARKALIDSMKAGSPAVRGIVQDVLTRSQVAAPEGQPSGEDPERAELDRLRAMKAARGR